MTRPTAISPEGTATDATADGQGIALMVMDLAPGAPLLSGINGLGSLRAALKSLRRIPELLALAMAELHALDPRLVEDLLGQTEVPVTTSSCCPLSSTWRRAPTVQTSRQPRIGC